MKRSKLSKLWRKLENWYYVNRAKRKGLLDKYGFTNRGGYIKGLGFSAFPYSANGGLFVQIHGGDMWARVVRVSERNKDKVIRCNLCAAPAVSLDHGWPYNSDLTLCVEHFKTAQTKKAQRI